VTMTQVVLTAVGDDREGLVAALSRAIEEHGGNWLDSQFARLAGKFAGIVLVELDEERVDGLDAARERLWGELGWKVELTRAEPVAEPEGRDVDLHLLGQDRAGLVRQVSAALAERGASIRTFTSWTRNAPEGGGMLFEAQARLGIPADLGLDAVRAAVEPIADELMVDVELAPASVSE
jgi:glycine cleavage system regulatory protein